MNETPIFASVARDLEIAYDDLAVTLDREGERPASAEPAAARPTSR